MFEKPVIETTRIKKIKITLEYVFRANFNDSYWLEEQIIELDKLDNEKLTWFDPYLGRSKINDTMVAFAYCSDEVFVVLSKRNGKIVENEYELYLDHTECEDYDERVLLASHISLLTK